MSLTYKAYKNGLLFSNGNYVKKVYDQYGNWTYNFAGKQEEIDTYIDDKLTPQVSQSLTQVKTDSWLSF